MGANPLIEAHLDDIDKELAAVEMPLADRPFQAALLFARGAVIAVGDGEGSQPVPDSFEELIKARWFAHLFKIVKHWFAEKYGEANLSRGTRCLRGFVNIHGAPFAIEVPAVTSRVQEEGKTAWMTYPIGIAEDESPLTWIQAPPDFSRFPQPDVERLRGEVTEQASALRRLNCSLTGTGSSDSALRGLLVTIRHAVEAAADIGGRPLDGDSLSQGYWQLQMLCECALKAVKQGKERTFRHIHDLGELYDDVAGYGIPYERMLLDRLPHWKTIANLRYGQGAAGTREAYHEAFHLAIKVSAQTLELIVSFKLAGGSFLLARPPWFASIDEDAA